MWNTWSPDSHHHNSQQTWAFTEFFFQYRISNKADQIQSFRCHNPVTIKIFITLNWSFHYCH